MMPTAPDRIITFPASFSVRAATGGRVAAWPCPDGQGIGVEYLSPGAASSAFFGYFPSWEEAKGEMARVAAEIRDTVQRRQGGAP
jgi:hypothetical protein